MKNQRRTEYFVSSNHEEYYVKTAIEEVKAAKEAYVLENSSTIDEIADEQITFQVFPSPHVSNPAKLFAMLTLTFYTKEDNNG